MSLMSATYLLFSSRKSLDKRGEGSAAAPSSAEVAASAAIPRPYLSPTGSRRGR